MDGFVTFFYFQQLKFKFLSFDEKIMRALYIQKQKMTNYIFFIFLIY